MTSIEGMPSRKRLRRLTVAVPIAVIGVSFAASVAAAIDPPPDDPSQPQDKVTICHVTPGNIVINTPAADGDVGGHAGHPDDIIPPFWFEDPSDPGNSPKRFDGLNWDAAGMAIYENDCMEVGPTTEPPPTTMVPPTTGGETTTTGAATTAPPTTGGETTTTVVTPTTRAPSTTSGGATTLPPTGGSANANVIAAAILLVFGGGIALAAARRKAA